MNIMLVTVTERTREIGLRKAVGASREDILLQFLIESTTISIIGGGLGIILGLFAAYGLGNLVAQSMPGGGDWGAVVEPTAILIAFSFAVGVGILFGLFPAMKASKLDPAEALRYQSRVEGAPGTAFWYMGHPKSLHFEFNHPYSVWQPC